MDAETPVSIRPTRPQTRENEAWLRFIGVAVFFIVWEIFGRTGVIDPLFISTPTTVFTYIGAGFITGSHWPHLTASFLEFCLGWGLAAFCGILIGVVIGLNQVMGETFEGILWFLNAAPIIVMYPLLIIWLGFGFPTVVAIAFLIGVFPILFNATLAVRSVDPVLVRCARSFGAKSWETALNIIIPSSVPVIVAGLRIAVGPTMIGVVLGELFGADRGLGFLIVDHGRRLQTAGLFGALILSSSFCLVFTTVLMAIENRVSVWRSSGNT